MRSLLPFSLSALFSLVLISCEALDGNQAVSSTTVSTPKVWSAASSGQNAKISTGWIKEFKDPRMIKLVKEALNNNQNLKSLAHRLRAAKEGTIIGNSARLPSLNASTSYRRSDAQNIATTESYGISLNAGWEPDLWGRLRNIEQAAQADYAATLADFRGARLSLAANTAKAWCNLVTAEQQLALAQKTLESYKTALPVVERRYRANTLRAVDVQFARNNVASAERSLRVRRLNRDNAARTLEIFLGRYPSATVGSSNNLPSLSSRVPAGLPAELLSRRPDLQAASADLYASAQRAESARKNLLPNLRLTGGVSGGDASIGRAFDPNFLVYSAAASLSQSIYQGGALNAQARAALERNKAEIYDYSRIALLAFREVEAALAADRSLAEQQVFLEKEVEQTQLAEKRALSDITLGIEGASFLEYLEAQRRSENAGISLIRLKNDRLQNRIDLHLALGGDYGTL